MIAVSKISTLFVAITLSLGSTVSPLFSDVYGPIEPVTNLVKWSDRKHTRRLQAEQGSIVWNETSGVTGCVRDVEVVLIQDATVGNAEMIRAMAAGNVAALKSLIGDMGFRVRIGLMAFRDKPVGTLGAQHDYCYRYGQSLTDDISAVNRRYNQITAADGGDILNNQLGALIGASGTHDLAWSDLDSTAAIRINVLITNSLPHFDLDGLNLYGLPDYFNFTENVDHLCASQYYPSAQKLKDAIFARQSYVAFMLSTNPQIGIADLQYLWLSYYLQQTADFVQAVNLDGSDFVARFQNIFASIVNVECSVLPALSTTTPSTTKQTISPTVSSAPTPTTTETVLPTSTLTSAATAAPTLPTITTTTGTLPPTQDSTTTSTTPTTSEQLVSPNGLTELSTGQDCAEGCECLEGKCGCDEVVIKLKNRPQKLSLDVQN